jgi:type IV pilus assembly protein PilF
VKLQHVLPIIGLLFLQSCHNNNTESKELAVKEPRLSEAATYNARLGLAYLKQGNRSLAKHKLLLALSQAPSSPTVTASMAYFLEQSGEIDRSKVYYLKAISLAPKSGAQLNNYGAFLCRQGQYRQAEEYFLKAINDNKYENTAGAYENAGLCVMAIPNHQKAEYYFNKALEYDPEREQSLYELVSMELKQDHVEESLAYLKKYPSLALSNRTLLSMAVNVAHKAGNTELEADYRNRLHNFSDNTGEKNEYNNYNNG